MASKITTSLRFVDSHPFPTSKRDQELLRAEARSHAATVSHRKYRRHKIASEHQSGVRVAGLPVLSYYAANEKPSSSAVPGILSEKPASQVTNQDNARPWQKFNQEDQPFHRYRVATQTPWRTTHREANVGRKRKEIKPNSHDQRVATTKNSIPLYKGNTDPFSTTVIPVKALEHLLLQQARAQSIRNTWPSEIALRHNHGALTAESLKKMPPFISDRASSHAIIAHAYFSSGSRQRIRGQPYEQTLISAERHKSLALRSLQESIEEQLKTGDLIKLKRIYDACCWLSAAEMLSGNVAAAIVHLTASKKIVDALGGWSNVPRMEKEILLGAVVNLAAGLRARPVMEVGNLDPGPWHARQWSPELQNSPTLHDNLKLAFTNVLQDSDHILTNVTARLRALFNDMRELLAVEDLKFKHATSQVVGTTQIFRWSHARKISVRARALDYWADLRYAAKSEGQPLLTLNIPIRVGVNLSSQLPLTMEFVLCVAMRTFDRCIFEEHYQPAGAFRESKRYHMELSALVEALRPTADDFSLVIDDRTYDMLWIYSVGAYVEDVFLRPELETKDDPVPTQNGFFSPPRFAYSTRNGFFSTRFAYLVGTHLEFHGFDYVTRLLRKRYLYYPRLQDASLRKLIPY